MPVMTLLLTLAVFLIVVLVLAAFVMMTGRSLKGSCGGTGGADCVCEKEGRPQGSCDERYSIET